MVESLPIASRKASFQEDVCSKSPTELLQSISWRQIKVIDYQHRGEGGKAAGILGEIKVLSRRQAELDRLSHKNSPGEIRGSIAHRRELLETLGFNDADRFKRKAIEVEVCVLQKAQERVDFQDYIMGKKPDEIDFSIRRRKIIQRQQNTPQLQMELGALRARRDEINRLKKTNNNDQVKHKNISPKSKVDIDLTKIEWGDKSNRVERTSPPEGLKLPNRDLSFMKDILDRTSSGGSACVPTATAYLEMIHCHANPREQQQILDRVMNKWRKGGWVIPDASDRKVRKGGEWLYTAESTILLDLPNKAIPEPGLIQVNQIDTHVDKSLEWLNLAPLLDLMESEPGEWISYRDDTKFMRILQVGPEKPAVVINCSEPLNGTAVYVSPNHPYWPNNPDRRPKVGGSFEIVGAHSLLIVDAQKKIDDTTDFYLIDPQTGCIVCVNSNEFSRLINRQIFHQNGTQAGYRFSVGLGFTGETHHSSKSLSL